MVTADGRTASDGDTADLIGLEKQFSQAIVKGDIEGLERLVSDDWIIVGPEGKVIERSVFFGVMKSGLLTHSTMESDEVRVRTYGNTGIVTARVVAVGSYQGQAFTTKERSTDVFVRRNGLWKCVLTQLTTIPEK